jgi:phosphoglycolate phosphatase
MPSQMVDWSQVHLVVFDVDGTLYSQPRLRRTMLRQLLLHAARSRSLQTLQVLRTFRRVREQLGNEQASGFAQLQYERTAQMRGLKAAQVKAIAEEWIEQRPLPSLLACRYPGLSRLFAALRANGKRIAVFSDYPASAKLQALGLQADDVACATDRDVGKLKPDPSGLQRLLARHGTAPSAALMIGDRADRDGAAASRLGVPVLLRSETPVQGYRTFRSYDGPEFQGLLAGGAKEAR